MIKVYGADIALIEEPEVFSYWFEKMNEKRRSKILRCKHDMDKKRSLLAGVLLKFALEQEGLCYEALEFDAEENGKPIIKAMESMNFSISHAGKYALCCISDEKIGADIEITQKGIFQSEKEDKLNQTADKILTKSEYEIFSNSDFEKKKRLFLKFWTRKESYSKAVGKGLGMDFAKIDTEAMQSHFWSEWLWEDCFASVYTVKDECFGMAIRRLTNLEM